DSYAHHPAELAADIAAVRDGGRVLALFQPHLYSRTRYLAHEFAIALASADAVCVTGIYAAREEPLPGVSGRLIVDELARVRPGMRIGWAPALEDAVRIVSGWSRPADIILTLGGGGAANAVVLHRARAAGLGGFEFACAIPGTIGGGVWMNGGAYGGDFSQVLVRALVATAGGTAWRTPAELGLSYRHSSLRHGEVVLQAELLLAPRPPEEIKATVRELNAKRKAAQPTNRRTFGSVFKNPDHELSAGRMLEA